MRFGTASPPAVFSPVLGLFGLALAWRRAADVSGAPEWVGETLLGMVTLLYIGLLADYLLKFARRPSAAVDDLRIVPGRAGLSAMTVSAMVLSAGLAPYSADLAKTILALAILAQLAVAGTILRILWGADILQRRMNPVWQLSFVGFIVAPVAAIQLQWTGLAEIIVILTLPMALTIYIGTAFMMTRMQTPPPLRPLLAIHLGPVSLLGLSALGLGWSTAAAVFALLALTLAAALLLRARYLTAAGFSPFWGAFTFPVAAFANLMLAMSGQLTFMKWIGLATLFAASIAIPVIAWRIVKTWMDGSLSVRTNAARV